MSNEALPLVVGHDKDGTDIAFDLATLPHLLIGGCTGSGKSVWIKSILAELMRTKTPDEVQFLLYDEKCVEFRNFGDSPYLFQPVVTEMEAFLVALGNLETTIQERLGKWEKQGIPRIIVVADEFAALMVNCGEKAEPLLSRILVNARAAGVHFIFATQRPDEIVLSGALRCGFPGRMAFKIYGRECSDLLIEGCDAESLNGRGEFLLLDSHGMRRGQGVFVSDEDFAKAAGKRIDFIANVGVTTSVKGRINAVMITYQGKDEDEGKFVEDLPGPCVSYLETGFLVGDESKWYFYNVDGELIKTELKAKFGECVEVSGMGDFYLFDRTTELKFLNGGKFTPDVDVVCINESGQQLPFSNFRIGVSNEDLFLSEDDEDYGHPFAGHSWIATKEQTQCAIAVQESKED